MPCAPPNPFAVGDFQAVMVNGTVHICRTFDLLEIIRLKLSQISEQVNLPYPFKLIRVNSHIGSSGSHAIFFLPFKQKKPRDFRSKNLSAM